MPPPISIADLLKKKTEQAQPEQKAPSLPLAGSSLSALLAQRRGTVYVDPAKFPAKELLRWFYGCYYRQFYVEHYRDLRLIADWLSPLSWPIPSKKPTRMLYSYDVMCLCDILKTDAAHIQEVLRQLMDEGFFGDWP